MIAPGKTIGIAGGGRIADQAQPVETVRDAARCAEVAAILGKGGADIGGGAVAVVSQRVDNDGNAARAIAFVADFLVILAFAARCLVDRALDIVLRHRLRLGGIDRSAQAGVGVRIGQAHLGRHSDFAGELGEKGAALFILRAFTHHDILKLGMPGHRLRFTKIEGGLQGRGGLAYFMAMFFSFSCGNLFEIMLFPRI